MPRIHSCVRRVAQDVSLQATSDITASEGMLLHNVGRSSYGTYVTEPYGYSLTGIQPINGVYGADGYVLLRWIGTSCAPSEG